VREGLEQSEQLHALGDGQLGHLVNAETFREFRRIGRIQNAILELQVAIGVRVAGVEPVGLPGFASGAPGRPACARSVVGLTRISTANRVRTPFIEHRSDCADGEYTYAVLVQGTDGNFYGTTYLGGANDQGTIFKLSASGAFTTLHSFDGTDGSEPLAGVVQAANGDFYGTTYLGGSKNEGTVFKITPTGTFTTLHSFCSQTGCADGENPFAVLVLGTDGNLYGTTLGGGGGKGFGTVFKITPSGTLTTLHSFCTQSSCADGKFPQTGLVQASNGNLYGTTISGGAYGDGTIFGITPSGKVTTLYNVCSQSGCPDGNYL
jgi:uncharacterized repeat protein (TIGR03803 family)